MHKRSYVWLNAVSPQNHWFRFCAIVMGLFVARGVFLLCIFPPLEAWDEYQHIGFLQHLQQTGEVPRLGETNVPRQVLEASVAFPQSKPMLDQTSATGSIGYEEYWKSGPPHYIKDHHDVGLYQAQHGSLYFRLVGPLFSGTGGVENLSQSMAVLRLVNLLFGAIAIGAIFWLIGEVVRDRVWASLLVVAISLHPLYLQNVCRVANDALAICLGTIVIVWAIRPNSKHWVMGAAAIGVALGCGAWAKGTNLTLFPFLVGAFTISAFAKLISWRQAIVQCSTAVAVGLAFVIPQFMHSIEQYGVLTPMQESVINHREGVGLLEMIWLALTNPWAYLRFFGLWFGDTLFAGGWSFLSLPFAITLTYTAICFAALSGWFRRCFSPSVPKNDPMSIPVILQMGCLVACVTLGLIWHMLQSNAAWGIPSTNSWYACLGAPFMVTLLILGAMQYRERIGIPFGVGMSACFAICNVVGMTLYLIPTYSQTIGVLALRRLAQLQPAWLGTPTCLVSGAACLGLFAVTVISWIHLVQSAKQEIEKDALSEGTSRLAA